MSVYSFIPPINPIRWVEKDKSIADEFGHKQYNKTSFVDSVSGNKSREPYYQPFYRSGIICNQFSRALTGGTDTSKINIYSERGQLLKTVDISHSYLLTVSGNTLGTEQLYVLTSRIAPSTYSELDGHNCIQLELELRFDSEYQYFVSAALIFLFTDNEGFSKIEYSCDTNKFNAYWENGNFVYRPNFVVYAEAGAIRPVPASDKVAERDMLGNLIELYDNVYNKYTFVLGGESNGVPAYLVEIVDWALACDIKAIDGKRYKLESRGDSSGDGMLQTKEYILNDKDLNEDYAHYDNEFELWTRPSGGYPYMIGNIHLVDNTGRVIYYEAKIFDNSGDESSFLTTLGVTATLTGSTGTFAENSGVFSFTNGTGESFAKAYDVEVWDTEFTLDVDATSGTNAFNYKLTYLNSNVTYTHGVNFGTGTGITHDLRKYSTSGLADINFTYPASTASYTIRIFHNNQESGFNCTRNAATDAVITDWDGDLPSTLIILYISGQDFSGLAALDLAPIAPTKNTLEELTIRSSGIDDITSGWASGLVVGTGSTAYKPFFNIRVFNLSGNTLGSTERDTIVNEFYNSTGWQGGSKTYNTGFQVPTAAHTAASSSATTGLTNSGWFVVA